MRVLVPFDGSPASEKALRFGAEFADNYDADVDAVHVTDEADERTETAVEGAREVLADTNAAVAVDPEVVQRGDVSGHAAEKTAGEHILELVNDRDYDHVVMGRHGGSGRLEQLVLGSATKVVVTESDTPVTVVP